MLVSEITQSSTPVLHYTDTIEDAIEIYQQNNTEHLPVINDEKYEGLLSLNELLEAADATTIENLKDKLMPVSVSFNQHILLALKLIGTYNISLLPVLSVNDEYAGAISYQNIINALHIFLSCDEPGGIFVLEMQKQNFSVGEICRLVETNDAYVTQLNTYIEPVSGFLIITLKVNKTEISDILATLQRYEYVVRYYFGEESYENELRENFDNLMSYLKI